MAPELPSARPESANAAAVMLYDDFFGIKLPLEWSKTRLRFIRRSQERPFDFHD
ncbi:MAG: hypothetical protein M5R42_16530 [Rhodocyclaceae bacterium]|nr:hypothetical protein [Rhodocyclaceae bacterium]